MVFSNHIFMPCTKLELILYKHWNLWLLLNVFIRAVAEHFTMYNECCEREHHDKRLTKRYKQMFIATNKTWFGPLATSKASALEFSQTMFFIPRHSYKIYTFFHYSLIFFERASCHLLQWIINSIGKECTQNFLKDNLLW